MIFLSHNHLDKPIVEPVALKLAEVFGKESVFYDSWSIQPGDGIIDRMNAGLENPRFVFFFVSEQSLQSKMVELEWQNSLMKATKGVCKLIPIRISDVQMPAILLQNLYIDMYSRGLEVTIHQIVNIVQGNNSFTPEHHGFSNLTWSIIGPPEAEIEICIRASHLMEPNPSFLILTKNTDKEISVSFKNKQPSRGGFQENIALDNGLNYNCFSIAPLGGSVTPSHPMRILATPKNGNKVEICGVMHHSSEDKYTMLPHKQ